MASIDLANINFCPGGGGEAKLEELTTEMLLTETTKTILPSSGYDGLSKVTVTHAPVEERTEETVVTNGSHVITPSEGFDATQLVVVDVNVDPSDFDTYSTKVPLGDDDGLKLLGWDDVAIKRFKYNNLGYGYQSDNFKVSAENIDLTDVIKTQSDVRSHKDDPNFVFAVNTGDVSVSYNDNTVTQYILDAKGDSLGTMFSNASALRGIYNINVPYRTSGNNAFLSCGKLKYICDLNVELTGVSNMFQGCYSLKSIPNLTIGSGVTSAGYMFNRCSGLTEIPPIDTSKIKDMNNMFNGCSGLTEIPNIDMSSATNTSYMFQGCSSLKSIPSLNIPNVKNVSYMFQACGAANSVGDIIFPECTNAQSLFYQCYNIVDGPKIVMPKATNWANLFYGCSKLESIPKMDVSSATTVINMFANCTSLVTLGGFTGVRVNISFANSPKLTHDSIMNVINEAADVTSDPKTMQFGSTNLTKISDEEKAIATAKGWTLS